MRELCEERMKEEEELCEGRMKEEEELCEGRMKEEEELCEGRIRKICLRNDPAIIPHPPMISRYAWLFCENWTA